MDVNALFQQAVAAGASDIHIEPLDEFVRIRWRKDGVLHAAGNCLASALTASSAASRS